MQTKPTVYACSGCSNVAQLANDIAVAMDREGEAEMSCIAGLGGNVSALVKKAKRAEATLAIDGCHLRCVKATLGRHQIIPSQELVLTDLGYQKKKTGDFNTRELLKAYRETLNFFGLTQSTAD